MNVILLFQLFFISLWPDTWQGEIWGRKDLILVLIQGDHSTTVGKTGSRWVRQGDKSRRSGGHILSVGRKQSVNRKWGWAIKPQGQAPLAHFLQEASPPKICTTFSDSTTSWGTMCWNTWGGGGGGRGGRWGWAGHSMCQLQQLAILIKELHIKNVHNDSGH